MKRLHPLPLAEIKDPMVLLFFTEFDIFILHGFPRRISNLDHILGMHCTGGESTRGSFSREPSSSVW